MNFESQEKYEEICALFESFEDMHGQINYLCFERIYLACQFFKKTYKWKLQQCKEWLNANAIYLVVYVDKNKELQCVDNIAQSEDLEMPDYKKRSELLKLESPNMLRYDPDCVVLVEICESLVTFTKTSHDDNLFYGSE